MFGDIAIQTVALATVAMLVGGTIKGTFGVGLPIAGMGLMTLAIDPHLALGFMAIPLLTTNLLQAVRAGRIRETLEEYWPIALALALALFVATRLVRDFDTNGLFLMLGLVSVIFAVTSLTRPPPPIPAGWKIWLAPLTGIIAGLMGGLTTVWGPPIIMYFLASGVQKDDFIRITGVIWFIGTLPLTVGFLANGLLNTTTAPISALMILPAAAGFWLGERVRSRIDPGPFRKALLWFFLLVGLNLVRRALF